MLLAVGTRVKFIHSQDQGVVTELLENGMVNVWLEAEDMEIPAFAEDLTRLEQPSFDHGKKTRIASGQKAKPTTTPPPADIRHQNTILESPGIQLAFSPQLRPDATATNYQIFLINDTGQDVLYTLELQIAGKSPQKHHGKLDALTYTSIGQLPFDSLNDNPCIEMECWRITTEGTGSRLHRRLRLKPKSFFKATVTAPLLNQSVHLFRVFEKLENPKPQRPKKGEDLKTYTQRYTRSRPAPNHLGRRLSNEVLEFAEFIPELDLHIEALESNYKKFSNAEILQLQLQHFERYLDKAIRLGVERVFIIHGLGRGRLRKAIHQRLKTNAQVAKYKNEYHPKYGYGATEVVIGE